MTTTTAIAADIRKGVAAQFPELKVSVRSNRSAWGDYIDVEVAGNIPAGFREFVQEVYPYNRYTTTASVHIFEK
jgi:hypothetical protein